MTTMVQAFRDLVEKGGAIIRASDADEDEIQQARYESRYYMNDDRVGFVLVSVNWSEEEE